jgi:hypothetical protein
MADEEESEPESEPTADVATKPSNKSRKVNDSLYMRWPLMLICILVEKAKEEGFCT